MRAHLSAEPPDEPEPRPTKATTPTQRQNRVARNRATRLVWTQLRLNRNFMNYPLARSARTQPRWREDKDVLWCTLPGENRIELSVPADWPGRRLPTGFDLNVLFRLLAAVQQSEKDHIEFASVAALLRDMHLTAHSKNCARVLNSFELWGRLAIFHSHWYQPSGPHVERNFPAPIWLIDFRGQGITITLNRDWVRLANDKQYFAAVPLPLPQESSAQNLALLALTSTPTRVGRDREHLNFSEPIKRRTLCRKIGLRHEVQKLETITTVVEEWFAARGGRAWLIEGGGSTNIKAGQVRFAFTPPAVPRKKPDTRRGKVRQNPTLEGANPTLEGAKSAQTRHSKGHKYL